MFSLFRRGLLLVLLAGSASAFSQAPLRVCADPDNLPFSNVRGEGFDNRIAKLLARDLHRPIIFIWARGRRGFLRERFDNGLCDVLMGVPYGMKHVLTTRPYYSSSYVFLTRRKDHLHLSGFDDPAIGGQRIGLQILEEDYSPPSLPLIRAGHASQFVGFGAFGRGGEEIVSAVARKKIGFAVVWGPVAGFYAAKANVPLVCSFVKPPVDATGIPFTFGMTIAVHEESTKLAEALDTLIQKDQRKINRVLESFHVPVVSADGGKS